MAEILIKKLAKDLDFDIISSGNKSAVDVECTDVNRPGLFLSGFHSHFDDKRIQVIGTAEQSYLMSMAQNARKAALSALCVRPFPFMVISNNVEPIPELKDIAEQAGAVVFRSHRWTATKLVAHLASYLNNILAPMETVHAVLLDIYGIGVLLTGDSGIGKSETALELVKRGHRLVADDAVIIRRISENRLVGEAPEVIKSLMEIRGVGIINIEHMYGISAIINSKSIDLVIKMELWDKNKDYDRLGLAQDKSTILGVSVPLLTIPVHPGRNLAIIMEAAARNTRLKQSGYDALEEIRQRKLKAMEE